MGAAGARLTNNSAYRAQLDAVYGPGWETRALKTLEQELRERGLNPRSGDDGYKVVPTPRLLRDRVSLALVAALIAALALCSVWAWREYLQSQAATRPHTPAPPQ